MPVKLRLIQPFVLAGIALIAFSSTAVAATTYHEKVAGVEIAFAPNGCAQGVDASSFAGGASGDVRGNFTATICHTPLAGSAQIKPGGLFTLSGQSASGQPIVPVTGHFTGGSVEFIGAGHFGTFCFQNFRVQGRLVSETAPTATDGFLGVLTHYGTWNGSSCNVTFATEAGQATITA